MEEFNPNAKGRSSIDEMVRGYLDGLDPDSPEPSENRSHSYRHGFANGRDDLAGKPRASADRLRAEAEIAMARDETVQPERQVPEVRGR